jgi:hypothetical protein
MKRILLIGLILLVSQVYAGDLYTVSLDNLDGRYLVGSDTLKSLWLPVYDAEKFALYFDVTTYDSTYVFLYYWLHPGIENSNDSTSDGYVKLTESTWTLLDSITVADSGKHYIAFNTADTNTIPIATNLQFIFVFGTDNDSLKFDSAPKLLKK